jgi:ribosomal protein S18 acetylase RimI-like enzyme
VNRGLHLPPPTHDRPVTLRPALDSDRDFLLAVYSAAREEELAPVPWSDGQKAAFLAQQFEAQDRDYRQRHPAGRFLVVEVGGQPAGRLYLAVLPGDGLPGDGLPGELRILDIALLATFRNAGTGSALLADLIAEADRDGRRVSLHVERWNRARRLYERLGFAVVAETDVYLLLERPPGHP